jgi:DNA-binding MarR family transcriptional regulator
MSELDPVIHQPARLRIMAALCGLGPAEQVDFGFLKNKLELTDGNLGAHLVTLEENGYIDVEKTFVGKKPKTFVAVTKAGRRAFDGHVAALRLILEAGKG